MFDTPLTIAHAIQLAVAPVFLLAAIGAMMNVFSTRLARIIDRARFLDNGSAVRRSQSDVKEELRQLGRRARLVHRSIGLCTGSALFVALVIATIFLGFLFSINMALTVAFLFVTATFFFILALFFFLREVHLATYSLSIGALGMANQSFDRATTEPTAEETADTARH